MRPDGWSRQRGRMTAPNNEQVRHFAVDLVAATATEMLLAKVAKRLTKGPSKPPRRYIRRAIGAVLSELVAEGLADLYWQRRRLRAEVDRRIVEARIGAAQRAKPTGIPSQRSVPPSETLAAELASATDRSSLG
jgi:hypothetical protein